MGSKIPWNTASERSNRTKKVRTEDMAEDKKDRQLDADGKGRN